MKDKSLLKTIILIIVFALLIIVYLVYTITKIEKQDTPQNTANVGFSTANNEDSEEELTNVKPIEEKEIYTNSVVLISLINNDWNRMDAELTGESSYNDGKFIYEDGYTLYSEDNLNIKKAVFSSQYEKAVFGDLSVGATQSEVKETLGTPTFESDEICGYKTADVYVFFYDDEIVVYPNISYYNSKFESLLFDYIDGKYDGDRTNFVVEIRNNYGDFDIQGDNEEVTLTSINRHIKIVLNGNEAETQITIYNGYNFGSQMEERTYIDETNTDLVLLVEEERIANS